MSGRTEMAKARTLTELFHGLDLLVGLDVFTGCGGLAIALAPWVQPAAYCEIDRFCQAQLLSCMARGELPMAPIWDDIRTLRGADVGPVDIVYGGFPCQDTSQAGAVARVRKGLDGERSGLFFEVVRLVREIRPGVVFLENVAGLAVQGGGLDRVIGALSALRYDCRWGMLRASDVGAPHPRERVWIMANAMRQGLQEPWPVAHEAGEGRARVRAAAELRVQDPFWSQANCELRRVADGIPLSTHRIRAMGNAVVPKQAREAFRRLAGI